jgi:hypothetical protein
VLKVQNCLFYFISNTDELEFINKLNYIFKFSLLSAQTSSNLFMSLSNKLEFVYELLDKLFFFKSLLWPLWGIRHFTPPHHMYFVGQAKIDFWFDQHSQLV